MAHARKTLTHYADELAHWVAQGWRPLGRTHSAAPAGHGMVVYVVSRWQGCARRLALPVAAWEAEVARRQVLSSGGTAWERTRETQQGRILAGRRPPMGACPDAQPGV